MSFAEILKEISKLSFAEREEIARCALSAGSGLSPEEEVILDERMRDFQEMPDTGIPLQNLEVYIRDRLRCG